MKKFVMIVLFVLVGLWNQALALDLQSVRLEEGSTDLFTYKCIMAVPLLFLLIGNIMLRMRFERIAKLLTQGSIVVYAVVIYFNFSLSGDVPFGLVMVSVVLAILTFFSLIAVAGYGYDGREAYCRFSIMTGFMYLIGLSVLSQYS